MTPYQLQTQERNSPPLHRPPTPTPGISADWMQTNSARDILERFPEARVGSGLCVLKKKKKQFNQPNPNCTQTIQLRKQKESKQNPHRPENSLAAYTPAAPPPQLLLHTQWEIKGSPEETLYFYPIQSNTSPLPHTHTHTHHTHHTHQVP